MTTCQQWIGSLLTFFFRCDHYSNSSFFLHSLDWRYSTSLKRVSVDAFEEGRGPRKDHSEMRMSARIRHGMLMDEWDVTMCSILKASRKTDSARTKRMATARKAQKQIRNEELLKVVRRIIKKMFRVLNKRGRISEIRDHLRLFCRRRRRRRIMDAEGVKDACFDNDVAFKKTRTTRNKILPDELSRWVDHLAY